MACLARPHRILHVARQVAFRSAKGRPFAERKATFSVSRHGSARTRNGLSLLEIVLAIGILLTALTVITRLFSTGNRASIDSQLGIEAMRRCELRMAELVSRRAGELTPGEFVFADDPAWSGSLNIADGPLDGLQVVTVEVRRRNAQGRTAAKCRLQRYASLSEGSAGSHPR